MAAERSSPRRVVIVGGGMGGLAAARVLRHADVDVEVTLVDRTNHHLFQPLLYQLAAGGLGLGDCAEPLRQALRRSRNTRVVMGEVTEIDAAARRVTLDRGEQLPYDSLVVACGATTSYFGRDEFRDVTFSLKTLRDAVELRDRFFGAFEEAERASEDAERDEWMTFVVVGGGATGVEVAGALSVVARHRMRNTFRHIDPRNARIVLLDARGRVVPAFSEKLSGKVTRYLRELGVELREGARAVAVDERSVTIETDACGSGSRRARSSGRPGCRPRRSRGRSPPRPVPTPTAPVGS